MKVKQAFTLIAFTVATLSGLQSVRAQSTWNLAGNSNATASSKLGTTNAIPLRLTTNNLTRVFIAASGKVGIGTSAPTLGNLVVDAVPGTSQAVFGANTAGLSLVSASNFPTIGFNTYFNGAWTKISSGFAARLSLSPLNGSFEFFNNPIPGPAGDTTPALKRMVIANNGFVGIGVNNPTALLHLGDPGSRTGLFLEKTGFGVCVAFANSNPASATETMNVENDGNGPAINAFSFGGNGIVATTANASQFAGFFNGNVFSTGTFSSSDEKLKQNIRDFNSAMSIINDLHPKLYQFKKDGNYALMNLPQGDHYGLIAQEVEKVLPNLVRETKFDTHAANTGESSPDGVVDFKALNYTELIPILIKAMQEQDKVMHDQDAKIEALTQLVKQLQGSSSTLGLQNNVTVNTVSLNNAALDQNIPNPLTNSTSIRYTIPAGSKAQLNITDNNGNTVKQILLNGGGKGVVNIEASTLSAGTYFYTLIVDGKKIEAKKMVIAR